MSKTAATKVSTKFYYAPCSVWHGAAGQGVVQMTVNGFAVTETFEAGVTMADIRERFVGAPASIELVERPFMSLHYRGNRLVAR